MNPAAGDAKVHRAIRRWALTLLLVASAPALATTASEQERASKELQAIAGELNQLDRWLNDAERQQASLQKELQQHDGRVAEVSRKLSDIDNQLAAGERTVRQLEAEAAGLQASREAQAGRIARHINAAYRLQRQDVVRALLNEEAPADLDRMLRYHRYFSDARMQAIRSMQTTLVALKSNQRALRSEREALQQSRAGLVDAQAELERRRVQRSELIRRLSRDMASKNVRQKQLLADRQRLEKLLAELERRQREKTSTEFAKRRGMLPLPVSGNVVFRYGAPRADGKLRWDGMVYRTSKREPVRAVHRGTVVFANWLRGFGMLTIIDHGNGYLTLYGYADDLLRGEGEVVEAGEVIAHAGQSGGQSFDGLYFEIRHKTSAVDPRPWLSR